MTNHSYHPEACTPALPGHQQPKDQRPHQKGDNGYIRLPAYAIQMERHPSNQPDTGVATFALLLAACACNTVQRQGLHSPTICSAPSHLTLDTAHGGTMDKNQLNKTPQATSGSIAHPHSALLQYGRDMAQIGSLKTLHPLPRYPPLAVVHDTAEVYHSVTRLPKGPTKVGRRWGAATHKEQ